MGSQPYFSRVPKQRLGPALWPHADGHAQEKLRLGCRRRCYTETRCKAALAPRFEFDRVSTSAILRTTRVFTRRRELESDLTCVPGRLLGGSVGLGTPTQLEGGESGAGQSVGREGHPSRVGRCEAAPRGSIGRSFRPPPYRAGAASRSVGTLYFFTPKGKAHDQKGVNYERLSPNL